MGEDYYDGVTADPLEFMFVKYKEALVPYSWAEVATRYTNWTEMPKHIDGKALMAKMPRVRDAWS